MMSGAYDIVNWGNEEGSGHAKRLFSIATDDDPQTGTIYFSTISGSWSDGYDNGSDDGPSDDDSGSYSTSMPTVYFDGREQKNLKWKLVSQKTYNTGSTSSYDYTEDKYYLYRLDITIPGHTVIALTVDENEDYGHSTGWYPSHASMAFDFPGL